MQEILVILVLALIFLGPKKLPELASGIGKAIREVRKATADIKSEIELDDVIRKPLEELREATMLPPEELKRRDEERKWRAEREKQDKLDAEARARGEVVPGDVATSSADDYHDQYNDAYHGDGHGDDGSEHGHESGDGYDQDPQSHAPTAAETGAAPVQEGSSDISTGELTLSDLQPVSPAAAPPRSPPSATPRKTPPLPGPAVPPG